MGDSWEDWDTEEVAVPGLNGAPAVDSKKFEDEDAEEEEPKWKDSVPKPQAVRRASEAALSLGPCRRRPNSSPPSPPPPNSQAKPRVSRYDESRGLQSVDDGPLDDPLAEKLRQQKLVEDADYEATMELFGKAVDLATFVPKSAKDYEDLGRAVAAKHLVPHARGGAAQYKAGIKALLHAALRPLSAQDVKDIETAVAGARAEKVKEEKAAAGGKKTTKKMSLNVGKGGGSAGLEDYVYDDPLEDDFDFM